MGGSEWGWVRVGECDSGGGWVTVVVTAATLILLGIPLILWVHRDQLGGDREKPDQLTKAIGMYRSPWEQPCGACSLIRVVQESVCRGYPHRHPTRLLVSSA